MPTMTLYRADWRKLTQIADAGGFKSWQSTTVEEGRAIIKMLMRRTSVGIPAATSNYLKGNGVPNKLKTLGDMSMYIKYTKDHSTVWVSTAINKECGGQGGGAPIYQVTVDLSPYLIEYVKVNEEGSDKPVDKGNIVAGARGGNLKPGLLMNNPNLDEATLIAVSHGPLDDAEVSFITPIPIEYISEAPKKK